MREVNFSIPNVNKASVGITTALYDRRALDCTSTLPLMNSLNHLAYLTTSSARIRDILTIDGGVERLVCLLKAGRTTDMMDMWKWNLAFQCVVNIGVRGSEEVRTRVVEADMVPVIATILDNYIKVVDRCREKSEDLRARAIKDGSSFGSFWHDGRSHRAASFASRPGRSDADYRSFRRQAPPPAIDILSPVHSSISSPLNLERQPQNTQSEGSPGHMSSANIQGQHPYFQTQRLIHEPSGSRPTNRVNLPNIAVMTAESSENMLSRTTRETDRLPSMLPGFQPGMSSQPESPTTPLLPTQMQVRNTASRLATQPHLHGRPRRRTSVRYRVSSVAAESDDPNGDSMASDESGEPDIAGLDEALDVPTAVTIQDITMDEDHGEDSILDTIEVPLGLTEPTVSEDPNAGTFNLGRTVIDVISTTTTPTRPTGLVHFSPIPTITNNNDPAVMTANAPRYPLEASTASTQQVISAMPRDEDVLMALQLLAYVSKYCNLRSYFQNTHLIPKLRVDDNDLALLDGSLDSCGHKSTNCGREGYAMVIEEQEEYLLPDDYNIFPLVEKFTVRHHGHDMQYWAGVVMRNLCRKDDSRGGIRQCAHYKCGKWEEYPRQFAKCRRCRRTKYCSKECQKSAWVFHRHWCVAASAT